MKFFFSLFVCRLWWIVQVSNGLNEYNKISLSGEMFAIGSDGKFSRIYPQVIAVFTATISAISDGMHYGWSAPVVPLLKLEDSPVPITKNDEIWLETINMMGAIVGLAITIYCVDKIGRQKSILLASSASLTAWILIATCTKVELLYLARFLTGIAGDVAFVSTPIYIAEIADQNIRGFFSGCIYLMMLIGILMVYSVAPFVPIYASSIVGGTFVLFQMLTFPFMPESPYYLLCKNKQEEAQKSLRWLRGPNADIEKELKEITAAVERQNNERGRPQDLILVSSNRKALIIMSVLNASQHLSSVSVILMNLHSILDAAGSIYIQSNTAAIIFSVLMLIAASTSSLIVDKYGRKILLITSSLLTALSLVALATFFAVKQAGVDVDFVSWIPIASILTYAFFFKFGLGIIPIIMTGELFPTSVKAMGMTIADAMYVSFAIVSIYIYQYLSVYGIHVPFYIFAGSCIFTCIFAIFYIPETKGKTLEEIQFILKGKQY